MKRIMLGSLLFLCSSSLLARIVMSINTNFDDFVSRIIPLNDQDRFKGYYQKLQEQIGGESSDKQRSTREYLYGQGFAALERNFPDQYKEIVQFVGPDYIDSSYDAERAQVREYVYWHGAYEEFKQAKQQAVQVAREAAHQEGDEKRGFVTNAKSYVAKATQKVGNWFKGWRKNKTV